MPYYCLCSHEHVSPLPAPLLPSFLSVLHKRWRRMEERRPGPSSRAVSPSQDELLSGWEGPGGAGGKGMDVPSQGPALLRDLSAFCLGLWLVLNPSDLGQAWSCSGGSRGGEKPFSALEAEGKGGPPARSQQWRDRAHPLCSAQGGLGSRKPSLGDFVP